MVLARMHPRGGTGAQKRPKHPHYNPTGERAELDVDRRRVPAALQGTASRVAPRCWQWPVFSFKGCSYPAAAFLQLLLAGDIETNPGPYTCPICDTHITSSRAGGGSVCCNSCRRWIHLRCTTLNTLTDYTRNWTCLLCHNTHP